MNFGAVVAAVTGLPSRGRVGSVNQPPGVNAGSDQSVSTGATVSLSATASDPDGTIASYAWTQVSGTAVTLSGASTSSASFTAPGSAATLVFRCTVTDNLGATQSDDVQVTVVAAGGSGLSIQPPAPVFATGGSGLITGINWVTPGFDDGGNAATPASYNLYWGPWSSSTTGTIGPAPNNSGNSGSRTGITSNATTNITGLASGQWAIVVTSVNSDGLEGGGSTEFIVTVT